MIVYSVQLRMLMLNVTNFVQTHNIGFEVFYACNLLFNWRAFLLLRAWIYDSYIQKRILAIEVEIYSLSGKVVILYISKYEIVQNN